MTAISSEHTKPEHVYL